MNFLETQFLLTLGVALLFATSTALLVLRWAYLWQLKEYRIDRMRDFFSMPSGRKALVDWQFAVNAIAVIAAASQSSLWPLFVLFVVQLFLLFRKRVRPVWTGKALGVLALALIMALGLGLAGVLALDTVVWMPVATLFSPLVVAGLVISLHPVTMWQRAQVLAKAKQRLEQYQTSVIGITGSFGKSTTKEFLHVMLKQRYTVLATEKNVNVDIGIAQTVLNKLTPEHDFFIAEMGAYRMGEIASSCRVAQPIIGILTAVADQHLSLYGSIEAIKQAKGELLRALPPGGLAVVNKDIQAAVEVSGEASSQVKLYSTVDFAHTWAENIVVAEDRVTFVLHVGEESIPVEAPLYGAQVVPSILGAATVARHVGCTMHEIATAASQLKPMEGTMHVTPGKNGSIVIDDHYNSNPEGFMAALDYQDVFAGKRKIVMTPGMYELADTTEHHHHSVAQRIAEVADVLLITKDDFARYMTAGAIDGGMPASQVIVITKPSEAIKWIENNVGNSDVVLLEGRVNATIVNYLLHN